MTTDKKKASSITLQMAGGEPFEIDVRDIQSLVSLSPYVTDLLLVSGAVQPVDASLLEVVKLINDSAHPVFKSLDGLSSTLRCIMNLPEYRRLNYS